MNTLTRNGLVRQYWEAGACGTCPEIVGDRPPRTSEWYRRVEQHRYAAEPVIHAVAQFTRHHGRKLLEIGVGAGTDHLQWARAGAECYGVDLTDEAIATTRAHLALYGFRSNLERVDAEDLPFDDASFDVVYSWGVIHHSQSPGRIVAEIRRVLRPGGTFIGMLYARYSLAAVKLWIRHALLAGRPWRSLSDVIGHHMESIGTRAYTLREVRRLFADFAHVEAAKSLTPYDTRRLPPVLAGLLPDACGWFIGIRATC
ncbi:MAG TPA: class I SAM-dependent methyltransferase [Planctomycetaceae bacterium]|nr:class I SAM-dependent methyltransferase [Planctomycetaceae bacterium]